MNKTAQYDADSGMRCGEMQPHGITRSPQTSLRSLKKRDCESVKSDLAENIFIAADIKKFSDLCSDPRLTSKIDSLGTMNNRNGLRNYGHQVPIKTRRCKTTKSGKEPLFQKIHDSVRIWTERYSGDTGDIPFNLRTGGHGAAEKKSFPLCRLRVLSSPDGITSYNSYREKGRSAEFLSDRTADQPSRRYRNPRNTRGFSGSYMEQLPELSR
jgi:hypothetical protein